jgi:hypothetical protein
MLQGSYDQIVKLIAEGASLSVEDIERRIEARRAKLSGLISKEGAAQIIASELGISFDKQKMKISNLLSGMRKINLVGKIIKMNRVAEYNKNGRSGKIGSFLVADETSNIRVVLWDTNHIDLIEKGTIKEGSVIEISGAEVRNSELHLGGFADIKISQSIIDNVHTTLVLQKKTLDKVQPNDNLFTRAFIVQMFGPTFFTVCPECGKRVMEDNKCMTHGNVSPKRKSILTLIIDDGTENMRAVLFSENIQKLNNGKEIENVEEFMPKRIELLGKEVIIEGNARKNKLSDSLEIFVNDIKEIELETLIEELEGRKA